ncbi:MAG: hypothetical protein ACTSRG_03970 [Candidatus Helarchaeota archaeon]
MYRKDSPVDKLFNELKYEGERIDDDTYQFISESGNQMTNLYFDKYDKKIIFSAIFFHADRMIEGNIFLFARILEDIYNDDEVRDIIEDISLQTKYLSIKPTLDKPEFGFKKEFSTDESTSFVYNLNYEDLSYEELRKKFEEILENSFKLVEKMQLTIGESIEKAINLYLSRPEIERKLLEIRKLIFKSQFFGSMTGRFAEEQKYKAAEFKKEAKELFEKFKKEYPDVDCKSIDKLFELI